MSQKEVVLIQKDVRDKWKSEAKFTPWLAKPEVLASMARDIGLKTLKFVGIESKVNSFRADIIAQDENSNTVIIENQLAKMDHDHLGKAITYAANKNAKIVIWVATDAKEEHIETVRWLNKQMNGCVEFYLVQIKEYYAVNAECEEYSVFDVLAAPRNVEHSKAIRKAKTELSYLKYNFQYMCSEWLNNNAEFVTTFGKQKFASEGNYSEPFAKFDKPAASLVFISKLNSEGKGTIGVQLNFSNEKACNEFRTKSRLQKGIGKKAVTICKKISDAYNDKKYPRFFLWYLKEAIELKAKYEKYTKSK